MVQYIIFGCLGKLIIYLAMLFPKHPRGEFWEKLFGCDLCLGVWIYTGLALIFRIDIVQGSLPYVPFVSELVTGAFTSFVVHLISLGWNEKFRNYIVEPWSE